MSPARPAISTQTLALPWPVLQAPLSWRQLDFISDLHLQEQEPETFAAWQNYLETTPADALFILGDLFEVWIGDDVLGITKSGFETRCTEALKAASRHLDIFLIHGNRDFLLGSAFASAGNLTLLNDPSVLVFAGERWLLSHGDALCLDDTAYMAFRKQVRSDCWQHDFLSLPLSKRQDMARALRTQSETRKRTTETYIDLDETASCDWLNRSEARTLIHGHTHHPRNHDLPGGLQRIVLSDWDARASPPRAEVLRLTQRLAGQGTGAVVQRLPLTA